MPFAATFAERPPDASTAAGSPEDTTGEDGDAEEANGADATDPDASVDAAEGAAGEVVPEAMTDEDGEEDAGALKRARATVHVTPELTATSIVAAMANQRTLTPVRRADGAATTPSRREARGITGASRRDSMPLHRSREGVRTGNDRADSAIPSRSATSIAQAMQDS